MVGAFDGLHVPATTDRLGPFDAVDVDAGDIAGVVADEFFGHDAVLTGILAHVGFHFGVTVVNAVDAGPLWPWVVARTLGGRLGEQFEICDRFGAVADGGTDAVVSCVTAANNNDIFAFGGDVFAICELRVEEGFGVAVLELHGEMNAVELTIGDFEITGDGRTGGNDDSVVRSAEGI